MLESATEKELISIRTPAWGVTLLEHGQARRAYFNSHPRVGGDSVFAADLKLSYISIRTPAWGVTCTVGGTFHYLHFNSHPRVGGDYLKALQRLTELYFNSHPRVGGDLPQWLRPTQATNFNSHPRVGGDKGYRRESYRYTISIRTPAWGVTLFSFQAGKPYTFQFAPPRGG